MLSRLTIDQARRAAVGAQGLRGPRPQGRVDVRHFRRVISTTAVVQLDSVNVLARAHYLPFFSRLGPYSLEALDDWLWGSGEVFEYWAHEASLVPVEYRPLLAHRMDGGWHWESIERLGAEHPGYVEAVLDEVRRRGPLAAGEVDDLPAPAGTWWDWSRSKLALEHLFLKGMVMVATRRNFTRLYDLPERVLPPEVISSEPFSKREAQKELLKLAVQSHGLGTVGDFADYFRISNPEARPLIGELVDRGDLVEIEVEGWKGPVYASPDLRIPRRVEGEALLAPFDPLVWNRDRTARLFDFEYRIEIYVPGPKRVYGYYVLPFLCDGRLVARVDLKADRQSSTLLVRGAYGEPGIDRRSVAARLGGELETMARWLGLSHLRVELRGDLPQFLS